MNESVTAAPRRMAPASLIRWLLALLIVGGTAASLLTLPSPTEPPPMRPVALVEKATFDAAAASLRAGRAAEAYGRFVALADAGDVDAARLALMMYRFGPTVFGSRWDASTEQLAAWTRWSQAAEDSDMAHLVQWPARCDRRQSCSATTPESEASLRWRTPAQRRHDMVEHLRPEHLPASQTHESSSTFWAR